MRRLLRGLFAFVLGTFVGVLTIPVLVRMFLMGTSVGQQSLIIITGVVSITVTVAIFVFLSLRSAPPGARERIEVTPRGALAVCLAYLSGFGFIMSTMYYRTALPTGLFYLFIGMLTLPFILGLRDARWWGSLLAIMFAAWVGYGMWPIKCSYCHDSNQNMKGNCVKRQRDGWCDEDYYNEHHNKSSCIWCGQTGEQTRFEGFLD